MAFTARLFMLLAIAVPILAQTYQLSVFGTVKLPKLVTTKDLPNEYPAEHEEDPHILEMFSGTNMDTCPPFGHPDNSYNVTVLGTIAPKIGGCASMVPSNPDSVQSFNLWLGSPKTGGGKCGDKNMDHYMFECKVKHPLISEEGTLEGWYVLLYDQTIRWTGHSVFRCVLYEIVNEDPPMFKMVISGSNSCRGLSKRMEQSGQAVPEGFRHIADGSIALIFSRDFPLSPMWRKKRSEEQGPWMQVSS